MRDAGPSYERYVAGLPGGLSAHPAAQVKGSVVRSTLEDQPAHVLARLPAPLRPLADDPPIDSEWVPETHLVALIHALAERRGDGEREYLAWMRARSRALFARPIYRIMMAAASPEALLRNVGGRWGSFHRGSALELEGFADDGARVALRFPPGLFDPLALRGCGEAFAAALEASRAREPVIALEATSPGFARWLARW